MWAAFLYSLREYKKKKQILVDFTFINDDYICSCTTSSLKKNGLVVRKKE